MNEVFRFFPHQNDSTTDEKRSSCADSQDNKAFVNAADRKNLMPFFLGNNIVTGCQGVYGGGYIGAGTNTMGIYVMQTKTGSGISATLSTSRGSGISTPSNSSHALFCGGYTQSGGAVVNADRFTWVTKICVSQSSANLPSASNNFPGGVQNPEWALHNDGSVTASRTTWSPTFTTSTIASANFSIFRKTPISACDLVYAMFFGGRHTAQATTYFHSMTDRVDWASFTAKAQPSASLSVPRAVGGSVFDKSNVFIAGGVIDNANTTTNVTDKMQWSTLTTMLYPSANITSNAQQISSLSGADEGIMASMDIHNTINFVTGISSSLSTSSGVGNPGNIGGNS